MNAIFVAQAQAQTQHLTNYLQQLQGRAGVNQQIQQQAANLVNSINPQQASGQPPQLAAILHNIEQQQGS